MPSPDLSADQSTSQGASRSPCQGAILEVPGAELLAGCQELVAFMGWERVMPTCLR